MTRGKPRHGHLPSPVLVYALAANGSQTVKVTTSEQGNRRSLQNVKTAAPATQR